MRTRMSTMVLSLGLALAGPSAADAQAEVIRLNIDQISCRDILTMGGEERDFALIFLHGFVSGQNGEMLFDGPVLTEATDTILDRCISTPDASALSVFTSVRG